MKSGNELLRQIKSLVEITGHTRLNWGFEKPWFQISANSDIY